MRCISLLAVLLLTSAVTADDWPQWLGPKRDGVWRETGLLDKFPKGGPKVVWHKAIGGGYGGPAVADGRVYVMDRQLDAGEKDPANPFRPANSKGKERVLCYDVKNGKLLWHHDYACVYTMSYPCGPRATPVIHGGKVYTLGAMGDLYCLDAKKGTILWHVNLVEKYDARVPVWGFAASPLIDGDNLITLAARKPVVLALNKDTGKEKWRALTVDSDIGYCPPMIYSLGGKRQLIVWHPEAVNGLDPKTGKAYWSYDFNVRSSLSIPTPRVAGNKLLVTSFYNGSRLLEVSGGNKPGVKEVWRSKGRGEKPNQTDKLHAIMATPFIKGDHIYGVCSYGELRCLQLSDGKRLWSDLTASGAGKEPERWANAFIVPQGERYFLFNEKGELIIAKLTPKKYEEIDRAKILDPTGQLVAGFSSARKIVWSHPAFANKCVFARNDKKIVCVSLAASK